MKNMTVRDYHSTPEPLDTVKSTDTVYLSTFTAVSKLPKSQPAFVTADRKAIDRNSPSPIRTTIHYSPPDLPSFLNRTNDRQLSITERKVPPTTPTTTSKQPLEKVPTTMETRLYQNDKPTDAILSLNELKYDTPLDGRHVPEEWTAFGMNPEEWAVELLGIEEEESEWQTKINKIFQHEEEILFLSQNEILLQEDDDKLFWENHMDKIIKEPLPQTDDVPTSQLAKQPATAHKTSIKYPHTIIQRGSRNSCQTMMNKTDSVPPTSRTPHITSSNSMNYEKATGNLTRQHEKEMKLRDVKIIKLSSIIANQNLIIHDMKEEYNRDIGIKAEEIEWITREITQNEDAYFTHRDETRVELMEFSAAQNKVTNAIEKVNAAVTEEEQQLAELGLESVEDFEATIDAMDGIAEDGSVDPSNISNDADDLEATIDGMDEIAGDGVKLESAASSQQMTCPVSTQRTTCRTNPKPSMHNRGNPTSNRNISLENREHEDRVHSSSSFLSQATTDIATNYIVDASIEYCPQFVFDPDKTVQPLDTTHPLPTYKYSSGETKENTSTRAIYLNESDYAKDSVILNQKLIGMTIVIPTSNSIDLPPPPQVKINDDTTQNSIPPSASTCQQQLFQSHSSTAKPFGSDTGINHDYKLSDEKLAPQPPSPSITTTNRSTPFDCECQNENQESNSDAYTPTSTFVRDIKRMKNSIVYPFTINDQAPQVTMHHVPAKQDLSYAQIVRQNLDKQSPHMVPLTAHRALKELESTTPDT